jgi:uncharacterized protein
MKPGDHPEFFRFPPPPGASRESTIRLDRHGQFWHDDEPVEHPKLRDALHRWVTRHPDNGRYILTNGYDWTYFTVEDTAMFVVAIHEGPGGDPWVCLANGEEQPLNIQQLQVDASDVLLTEVTQKQYTFPARFTRQAQTQLAPWLVETDDGQIAVQVGSTSVVPRKRTEASLPN